MKKLSLLSLICLAGCFSEEYPNLDGRMLCDYQSKSAFIVKQAAGAAFHIRRFSEGDELCKKGAGK